VTRLASGSGRASSSEARIQKPSVGAEGFCLSEASSLHGNLIGADLLSR